MTRLIAGAQPDTSDIPSEASTEERLEALIRILSDYIEHYHGGWVKMVALEDDTLKVKMGGACEGCPLSATTLHGWIAGTVTQFFPQIKSVVAVETTNLAEP
ncbi:MAG: NifU family protein [Chloroflexi bacterium]|nr:MAG: NifU family protein [Chloroflexota bacterium]